MFSMGERKLSSYPCAVMVRINPDERDQLNALAATAGLSLQNYARQCLGLPLPEKQRRPYFFKPGMKPNERYSRSRTNGQSSPNHGSGNEESYREGQNGE